MRSMSWIWVLTSGLLINPVVGAETGGSPPAVGAETGGSPPAVDTETAGGVSLPTVGAQTGGVPYSPPEAPELVVQVPAQPRGSLLYQGRLYLAMGTAGVAIYQLEGNQATLLEVRSFDGEATGVSLMNGRPWVTLHRLSAVPLFDRPNPAAPIGSWVSAGGESPRGTHPAAGEGEVPGATASSRPQALDEAAVLEAGPGYAIVDRGLDDGLTAGDRMRFLRRVQVPASELGMEGDTSVYREEEAGLGEVGTISRQRSRVLLARGAHIKAGDRVERLSKGRGKAVIAPDRPAEMTEVRAILRPFLAVGTLGLGTINEITVSWFGAEPYFVEASIQPVTLGWSKDGNLLSASLVASGGYDHRLFGVGLGLGFTAANTGVTDVGLTYETADTGEGASFNFEDVRQGFTIAQVARLGARDGLRLELRNNFVLATVEEYEGGYELDYETGEQTYTEPVLVGESREFRWSSTRARIQLPVARVSDLFVDVGGGTSGYFDVEGGVQSWLRGSGDRGSLGISVGAGFGMLTGKLDDSSVTLKGPLVVIGLTWRG